MKKEKNLLHSLIPSPSSNELYLNVIKSQRLDMLGSQQYSTWNLKQEMTRRINNFREQTTTQTRCRTQVSDIQIRPKSNLTIRRFKGDEHKYNWIIKQSIVFDQSKKKTCGVNSKACQKTFEFNERNGSPPIFQSQNSIKSSRSPGLRFTESRGKESQQNGVKERILPSPPQTPGFIYNGRIKLRVQTKQKTQAQEEQPEQEKIAMPQTITEQERKKLSKFCSSPIVVPENHQSSVYHDLDKQIRISQMQYQYITTKFPLNTALKSLFLDEAMKQKNEELEKYYNDKMTFQELQAKEKTYEKHEELVRLEYRRKCYFEYESMKQLKLKISKKKFEISEENIKNVNEKEIATNLVRGVEKKNYYRKLMSMIKQYLIKLSDLKLSIKEAMFAFPSKPFERANSREFFECVILDNRAKASKMVDEDRLLVYQFDHNLQTALHVATKRGHEDIVRMLIENYADVNAKDMLGRTPLYFGFREGQSIIVKALLMHRASPWGCGRNHFEPFLYEVDDSVRNFYRKARHLHLQMKTIAQKDRDEFWKSKVIYFDSE